MIDFKDIVDRLPDMVFAVDPESYNILYVNTGVRNVLGCSQEECLGQPGTWWDAIHVDDKEKISRDLSVVIQTGEEKILSYRIHSMNGNVRYVRTNIALRTEVGGRCKYIIGLACIDDGANKALDNTQENLIELIEDCSSVVYRCMPYGNYSIKYVTSNMTRLLGISPEELINKNSYWFDNLHPDDRDNVFENLSGLQDIGHCVHEYRFKDSDGEYRWIRDELQLVRDADGSPEAIVGNMVDITKTKYYEYTKYENEKTIDHANKMRALASLIGGVAHEFNNMLGVVIGYGGLLLKMPGLNDTNEKYIKHILSASNRSKLLVQQLLIFSRKNVKNIERVNVCDKINEEISHIRSVIPDGVDLEVDINCENQSILIDLQELRQILENIINNAVYALQDTGVVKIAVEPAVVGNGVKAGSILLSEGEYVKISVTDNGPGISKGEYQRIFEPFYTTKAIGIGTGMGLAVVYSMLKSYGGGVNVHSEKNVYTTFELYLPVADQSALSILKPTNLDPVHEHDGFKILYVDDEELYIEAVCDMLTQLGHQVTAYTSAKEAFKNFVLNPYIYDLVIVDHIMPGIMGEEFSRAILRVRQDIDIIICTGDDTSLDKSYLRDNGIKSVLVKPFTISALEYEITGKRSKQAYFH